MTSPAIDRLTASLDRDVRPGSQSTAVCTVRQQDLCDALSLLAAMESCNDELRRAVQGLCAMPVEVIPGETCVEYAARRRGEHGGA